MSLQKTKSAIVFFSLVFLTIAPAFADDPKDNEDSGKTPWDISGYFSQQVNQASFSYWERGGENSLSSTSNLNFKADFDGDQLEWENRLNLRYGILKTEGESMQKNEDRIRLNSRLGREISPHFRTTVLTEFQTQFDKGYRNRDDEEYSSRFMAPGELTLSLGIDYRPWKFLSVFVSPASGRLIFVLDQKLADRGAYGVDPAEYDEEGNLIRHGRNSRAEFGAAVDIRFEKEIMENINVESRLGLFNDLTDEDISNRKNTDVDWETIVNLQVNRYISASFLLHMLYAHDTLFPVYDDAGEQVGQTRKIQLKQLVGLGLTYNF